MSALQTLLDDFARRIGSSRFECVEGEASFVCDGRLAVDLCHDVGAACLRIGTRVGHSSVEVTAQGAYWKALALAREVDPGFQVGWNPHTGELLSASCVPLEGLDGDGFAAWIQGFLGRSMALTEAWEADPGQRGHGLPLDDCRCIA